MKRARKGSRPNETDSSTIGNRPEAKDQAEAETETTKTEAGEATSSHRPAKAAAISAEPEKSEEEEYILEREPNGRYRIVGRRPRKQESSQ